MARTTRRTRVLPRRRDPLVPSGALEAVASRFRALSVAARLRILDALMSGPATVGSLVAATGLEQSNLSRHVSALERAGCVRRERRGRTVVVSVSDPTLRPLCDLVCASFHPTRPR